jgi:AcrR family transcriptional regulator
MMEDHEKSRGRPRSFDPDKVLGEVQQVFWRQGYEGTSYSDLTAATGLSKPSLYAAFGDKESLFAAALDRYNQGPNSLLTAAFEQSTDLRQGIEALLRGYVDLYTSCPVPSGCMAASTLAESTTPGFPTGLRDRLLESSESTVGAFLRRARRAAADGSLPEYMDAEGLVNFLTTFGLGIATAAKSGSSRASLHSAVTTALSILGNTTKDEA